MKYREHRGSLDDAMATCVEIEATYEALLAHIQKTLSGWPIPNPPVLEIKYYCYDTRIQWETYIVALEGWGVVGFTNAMPTGLPQQG